VSVAAMAGSRAFAFGASIAIRRDALSRIGGFMSIVNQLADDYRLGEMTRQLGLRTVLSNVVVDIAVAERGFRELVEHELRWLCTIRSLRPLGYSLCVVTFTLPAALLATILCNGSRMAFGMLAIAVVARVSLHLQMRRAGAPATQLMIIPVRDMLSFVLWSLSFLTRRVRWGDDHLQVTSDGSVELVARITP